MNGANFFEPESDDYQFNSTDSDDSTNENIDWNEKFYFVNNPDRGARLISATDKNEKIVVDLDKGCSQKNFLSNQCFH